MIPKSGADKIQENQRAIFNLKSSNISQLSLSDSFEYLCHGSTIIINILILSAQGPSLFVRICRLQTADSGV